MSSNSSNYLVDGCLAIHKSGLVAHVRETVVGHVFVDLFTHPQHHFRVVDEVGQDPTDGGLNALTPCRYKVAEDLCHLLIW